MSNICLCCGKPLKDTSNYWHPTCIRKMFNSSKIPSFELNENKIIEDNVGQGNTVTGVQKKFSLETSVKKSRKTVSVLNHEYIVKTPQESMPNVTLFEWIGMKLASICGINTVECGLIKYNDNYLYITKRIDRNNGKKIPMEDFCQLSNTQTEYKYNGSYERCYKSVIKKYSSYETIDKIRFFQLLLFSYIIGNTDMHLKNFSLYEIDNKYQLTPAYDLVPVLMVFHQEEMALTLNGKNTKLTKNDFVKFGERIGIEKRIILQINKEMCDKKEKIFDFIRQTDLTKEEKIKFIQFISDKIELFDKPKQEN